MSEPTITLSDEQATKEAQLFIDNLIGEWSEDGKRRLLAAIFQRVYQEGVLAGMDRAIAKVKKVSER